MVDECLDLPSEMAQNSLRIQGFVMEFLNCGSRDVEMAQNSPRKNIGLGGEDSSPSKLLPPPFLSSKLLPHHLLVL